jgi:phage terminase large subunit
MTALALSHGSGLTTAPKAGTSSITLPHNWDPRPYQQPAWNALERGIRRALLVWHRRAGKDDVCLHWAATQAMQKPATYWHMLPQYEQARKAVWDAVNPRTGKRRIDEAFPDEICQAKRDKDMFIRLRSGSTWQLVGSDNYNSLVGTPPYGVTASEWALSDPLAWAYLRPILRENGGWAVFISTVRGKNHMHRLFEGAKNDPEWFVQVLKASDTGIWTAQELEKERLEYQRDYGVDDGDALFAQEYLCDWHAAIHGSYYGRMMRECEEQGRIRSVPYDPMALVHTAWDLGLSDSTVVWFFQVIGAEIHVIDYLENSGQPLAWYAGELQKKPYAYGDHILPRDADSGELQTARSRSDTLRALLGSSVRSLTERGDKRILVADGVNAVRTILPRCYFDAVKCERGIECLKAYRRKWDEERKTFHDRPEHDWASHGADGFRYLATGLDTVPGVAMLDDAAEFRRLRGLSD